MSHRKMPKTNRWDCLKPESSSTEENNNRVNRFKAPTRAPTNSRWKRSKSPEVKINTFKSRRRGYQGGRFRNNRRGRGGSSIFANAKRDDNGRPILKGSITQGFDITSAIKSTSSKQSNKERRKQREAQKKKEKEDAERQRKLDEEKAAKELEDIKADSEWNKAMMERFMYEEESSSDDESDED